MSTTTSNLTAGVIREAVDSVDASGKQRMYEGSYSGRGMYGKGCVAVCVENMGELVALGAQIAMVLAQGAGPDEEPDEMIDGALDVIAGAEVDSLGLGYVVYWPGIPAED